MTEQVDPKVVEVVARAICKSRSCEGISCCQWPAQRGRTKCPVDNTGYDDAARDAIQAFLSSLSSAGMVVVPKGEREQ